MSAEPKYWFPAKRYGWGWGVPSRWQGQVVLLAFFAFLGAGALFLIPRYGPPVFVAYSLALTVVLILICLKTGEPPRWRSGDGRD